MKTILILFLSTFLTMTFAKGRGGKLDPAVKEQLAKEFKSFQQQSQQKRRELLDKIYQLRLAAVKGQHDDQMNQLHEVEALMDKLEFGKREENKKVRAQIKELRAKFKEELKAKHKSIRDKIKELRKEFRIEQKETRQQWKEKMKSLRTKK